MLSVAGLAERRLWSDELGNDGRPAAPLLVIDLDTADDAASNAITDAAAVASQLAGRTAVLVGTCQGSLPPPVDPLVQQLDVVLSPVEQADRRVVGGDVEALTTSFQANVARCPVAALCLTALLRQTSVLPANLGLLAESFAYSTLLAGPEHARWLKARPSPRLRPPATSSLVRMRRTGDVLEITLADPQRRNAFSRRMRDELVESLALLDADDTIREVRLRGEGPAFCSGGDLDEFGTTPDPATAHLIRAVRSVALRLEQHRECIRAQVHGTCVGAGVELAAVAGRVQAAPDTTFVLPEVSMGLVPGAGGTVSITRRIGRWRTAYLALSGAALEAGTACNWGLVDEVGSG